MQPTYYVIQLEKCDLLRHFTTFDLADRTHFTRPKYFEQNVALPGNSNEKPGFPAALPKQRLLKYVRVRIFGHKHVSISLDLNEFCICVYTEF